MLDSLAVPFDLFKKDLIHNGLLGFDFGFSGFLPVAARRLPILVALYSEPDSFRTDEA